MSIESFGHSSPELDPKQLDEEQIQLGSDPEFWKLIEARRTQKTISRAELERRLDEADKVAANEQ